MSPNEFTDWLSDLLEFYPDLKELNEAQTQLIKDKINTVFNKVTPELNAPVAAQEWKWFNLPNKSEVDCSHTGCPTSVLTGISGIDGKMYPLPLNPAGQSPNIQYCGFASDVVVDTGIWKGPIVYTTC